MIIMTWNFNVSLKISQHFTTYLINMKLALADTEAKDLRLLDANFLIQRM